MKCAVNSTRDVLRMDDDKGYKNATKQLLIKSEVMRTCDNKFRIFPPNIHTVHNNFNPAITIHFSMSIGSVGVVSKSLQ